MRAVSAGSDSVPRSCGFPGGVIRHRPRRRRLRTPCSGRPRV